ncbi:hypothetical protein CTAYLR_005839 [Chrysophaeum taylorii]|uniref:E3 ubiquitin-protein ligase RBBP6 n=1 Tax=Chrysophaeum taylorii TaxID=2483200 RepID=A0AAD7XRZ8_9STRA|nr:hypothetical protein CTAYLR_005839 [Chrysophaeum taylorii]
MSSSVIQFRFSSSKSFDAIEFSGLMIKLLELKRAIVEKRNLMRGMDFDLSVANAQTSEVYADDDMMIPKNTAVVVRRVPTTGGAPGLIAKLEGKARGSSREAKPIEVPAREAPSDPRRRPGAAPEPPPKEDETAAVLANVMGTVDEFRPKGRGNAKWQPRGAQQGAKTGGAYVCHRCGKPGHFIRDCPEAASNGDRFRHGVAGVPRAFWKQSAETKEGEEPKVEGIQVSKNRFDALVKRGVGAAPDDPVRVREAASKDNPPHPLVCPLCRKLFQDAVIVPCCTESACDACIRAALARTYCECPLCRSPCTPDQLLPNKRLRSAVEQHLIEWLDMDRKRRAEAAALEVASGDAAAPRPSSALGGGAEAPDAVLDLAVPAPPRQATGEDDFGGDVFSPTAQLQQQQRATNNNNNNDNNNESDDYAAATVLAAAAAADDATTADPLHLKNNNNNNNNNNLGYPPRPVDPSQQHQQQQQPIPLAPNFGYPPPFPYDYRGPRYPPPPWGDPRFAPRMMPYPPRPPSAPHPLAVQPVQPPPPWGDRPRDDYPRGPPMDDYRDDYYRRTYSPPSTRRGPPSDDYPASRRRRDDEAEDLANAAAEKRDRGAVMTYREFVELHKRESRAARRAKDDDVHPKRRRRRDDSEESRKRSDAPKKRRRDKDGPNVDGPLRNKRADDKPDPPRSRRRREDDRKQDTALEIPLEIRIGCHKPSPPPSPPRDDDRRSRPRADDDDDDDDDD